MASSARLHTTKDPKVITGLLKGGCDANARDAHGDAPIHIIVRRSDKQKFESLMALLIHSDPGSFDINALAGDGNSALHLAVKDKDITSVKALLAFGADINSINAWGQTPLDIALEKDNMEMAEFLGPMGAFVGYYISQHFSPLEKVPLASEKESTDTAEDDNIMPVKLMKDQGAKLKLDIGGGELQSLQLNSLQTSALATLLQKRQARTGFTPPAFHVQGGERILCLDGGGIKGLIQVEVLMQIEQLTGRAITELFDWIVGTSTGGIIALAMVYTKKTLPELRKLYFELKEDVFSTANMFGYDCNTQKLEILLKEYLGETTRLSDVLHPKVMITAVDSRDTSLELRFFNNCFFDAFSDELVWKVARCTSAAPVYFKPMGYYVDGGIRANNPTAYALTAIQNYLDQQAVASKGPKPKYACVVSVGCGIYPPEKIGDFDIFGKGWLHLVKFPVTIQNLIKLLSTAVTESEGVADNCRSRCEKQGIPFYRFSPLLDEVIPLSESDSKKLCGIILKAKMFLQSVDTSVDELIQLFHTSAKFAKDGRPKF